MGGIITYLAGVKARREEHERWQAEWRRQEQRRALARAREERETNRHKFLERLMAMSTEAHELRSFLARLPEGALASQTGDLARMLEWAKARLEHLEDQLTAEAISAALRQRELFPEVDRLVASVPEEE